MLKVVAVVDKVDTALDRLAKGVIPYHDNLDYHVVDVHPKRPSGEQLQRFEDLARDADIIEWQYFRTAEMLRAKYDWLKSIKQILSHNNPYSIEESDWNGYDVNVANNKTIEARLREITNTPVELIPITVDTDFWEFNRDWSPNKNVIMVANRIESKKGILPVALACSELNLHLILVGAISDVAYFNDIMACNNVEFHEQISDLALRDLYYKSTIHVCNSIDNFESGTMPVLESMLCGVPVLSRNVGHVPDFKTDENITIFEGESEDVQGLIDKLSEMIHDKKRLESQRQAGWNSIKNRNFERRAFMYQKLYRSTLFDTTPVSVVMPIYDKPDIIRKSIDAVINQTYKNIELIVVDDNEESNKELIQDISKYSNMPIRYINNGQGDYGLARARNRGAIEATGDILVFCDQRMVMQTNAVIELIAKVRPKNWVYGNKGAKKDFIENFSCVYKEDFMNCGMFNERMDMYGGLSQETRIRIRKQGFQTDYVDGAIATPTGKSSNKHSKRQEIIKIKNRLFKMGLE